MNKLQPSVLDQRFCVHEDIEQSTRVYYLELPLGEGSGVEYGKRQGGNVRTIEGLQVGHMWIERTLSLTPHAFASAVFASLEYWMASKTFHILSFESPRLSKFRDADIISDPGNEILITLEEPHYPYDNGFIDNGTHLIVPLISFSIKALEIINQDGMILVPNEDESTIRSLQSYFERIITNLLTFEEKWEDEESEE